MSWLYIGAGLKRHTYDGVWPRRESLGKIHGAKLAPTHETRARDTHAGCGLTFFGAPKFIHPRALWLWHILVSERLISPTSDHKLHIVQPPTYQLPTPDDNSLNVVSRSEGLSLNVVSRSEGLEGKWLGGKKNRR